MLYLACDGPVPERAWNPADRHVHTRPLLLDEEAVRGRFSLSEVAYVGSSQECGCGFRSITRFNGDVLADMLWEMDAIQNGDVEIANHRELCELVDEAFLRGATQIELYGCWSGDEQEVSLATETSSREQLSHARFCFREGNLYRITGPAPVASEVRHRIDSDPPLGDARDESGKSNE